MNIAVTSENGNVFQHFGHTPEFSVFEVSEGRLIGMRTLPAGESGHGALAALLAENKINILICGGIGAGAQEALKQAGIQVVGGVEGDIVEAVGNYLLGTLQANQGFTCSHSHDHEHSCGGDHHSCGSHGHCH